MKASGKISRRDFARILALAGLCFAAHSALPAFADDGADNKKIWDKLSETEKNVLRQRYEQYQKLDAEGRARLDTAAAKFSALSDAKKAEIRTNYERWKNLSAEQRDAIRVKFARWKELPDSMKQLLREKNRDWENLSAEERLRLLQDAGAGESKTAK